MDEHKIEYTRLIHFIFEKVNIQISLFHSNPGHSLKLDFENRPDGETRDVLRSIIRHIFSKDPFWVCELGSTTASNIYGEGLLYPPFRDMHIVPFNFPEDDYFEYDANSISCCRTNFLHFNLNSYIEYALGMDFISNLICLIDDKQGVAVHIYDRRGMDIVSTNLDLLMELDAVFHDYLSKYWKTGIQMIDNP